MDPVVCLLQSVTRVRGSIQRRWTGSSTPSSRRSPKEWGWGCRSAARSSKPMAVACGRRQIRHTEPSFGLPYRSWPKGSQVTVSDDEARSTVVVIDDDQEMREALQGLL